MRTTLLLDRAASASHRAAPWARSSLLVLHLSWASLSRWPLHHCPVGMAPPFVFITPPWRLPFLVASAKQLFFTGCQLWRSVDRRFRWISWSIMGRISVRPKARS